KAGRVNRGLAGRHERGGDHPQQGDHRQQRGDDEQRVHDDRLHVRALRCNHNCSIVAAPMKRKRMNATAAAYPMFHQRKPCWYISMTTESVLLTGPPRVITYGSGK